MRKRIFEIVEIDDGDDILSKIYDIVMFVLIILSLVPIAFKNEPSILKSIDYFCVAAFIFDYAMRLITADYKYGEKRALSFIRYPFSPMAIIDLISILPSLKFFNRAFRMLRLLRMMRTLRLLRVFKAFRYSRSVQLILSVLKRSKEALAAVCTLAVGYVLVSALIMFNVEPGTFDTFFDAVYWATVSLTTVGYGDIYPVTTAGKVVSMFSSVFGIAIVALPAGIITAGYMNELQHHLDDDD